MMKMKTGDELQKADKITCVVDRSLSADLLSILRDLEIPGAFIQTGRSVVLRERRWALDPHRAVRLEEDPVELIRFYVPRGHDAAVISHLAVELDLRIPGRGSLYSERVELRCAASLASCRDLPRSRFTPQVNLQSGLVDICCIVQRGEADGLARAVLEMGLSVPVVTYGTGLGLRNKLGLLRITIPVEKEVLHLVVSRQDALEAFNYLTDAARLWHPGRGFIYMSPLTLGVINTKIYRGELRHVASMEQIIAAVDMLTRGTEWRRRATTAAHRDEKRRYLSDMANFTLISEEGSVEALVRLAMQAGAGGATVFRLRFVELREQNGLPASRASEASDLIMQRNLVKEVHKTIRSGGVDTSDQEVIVDISSVEKASTYRYR
jgi:hypothetical protein